MTDFSLNLGLAHTSGHDLPVSSAPDRTPEGLLRFDTYRNGNSGLSAVAAVLPRNPVGPATDNKRTFRNAHETRGDSVRAPKAIRQFPVERATPSGSFAPISGTPGKTPQSRRSAEPLQLPTREAGC